MTINPEVNPSPERCAYVYEDARVGVCQRTFAEHVAPMSHNFVSLPEPPTCAAISPGTGRYGGLDCNAHGVREEGIFAGREMHGHRFDGHTYRWLDEPAVPPSIPTDEGTARREAITKEGVES